MYINEKGSWNNTINPHIHIANCEIVFAIGIIVKNQTTNINIKFTHHGTLIINSGNNADNASK